MGSEFYPNGFFDGELQLSGEKAALLRVRVCFADEHSSLEQPLADASATTGTTDRPVLARSWVPLCATGEGTRSDWNVEEADHRIRKNTYMEQMGEDMSPDGDNIFRNGTLWLFRRTLANADPDIAELIAGAPRALPRKRRGGC